MPKKGGARAGVGVGIGARKFLSGGGKERRGKLKLTSDRRKKRCGLSRSLASEIDVGARPEVVPSGANGLGENGGSDRAGDWWMLGKAMGLVSKTLDEERRGELGSEGAVDKGLGSFKNCCL